METVQDTLTKILWDRRYVALPKDLACPGGHRYLLVMDPTPEDRNLCLFMKDSEYAQARAQGVPTEEELLEISRKSGNWEEHDDIVLRDADDHIAFLEGEVKANAKFKSKQNNLKRQLAQSIETRDVTLRKLEQVRTMTAEYQAHEISIFYLLQRTVCTPDGMLFWPTEAAFLQSKEHFLSLVVFMAHQVVQEGMMNEADLRLVGRSPDWRILWGEGDNYQSLFGKCASALNINQRLLIYWSRVYDSVFSDPDRPDLEIIDDDERLDEWMANRDIKRKEEKEGKIDRPGKTGLDHNERMVMLDGEYVEACHCGAKAENSRVKGLGEKKSHDVTCPYGTWRKYSTAEKEKLAQQVYSRNSSRVRGVMKRNMAKVNEKGGMEDQHLYGDKRSDPNVHIMGFGTNVTPMKRR